MQPRNWGLQFRWIRLKIEGPAAEMWGERQAMTKEHESTLKA